MTLEVVHMSDLHVVSSKRHPVDAKHCSQVRFILQQSNYNSCAGSCVLLYSISCVTDVGPDCNGELLISVNRV